MEGFNEDIHLRDDQQLPSPPPSASRAGSLSISRHARRNSACSETGASGTAAPKHGATSSILPPTTSFILPRATGEGDGAIEDLTGPLNMGDQAARANSTSSAKAVAFNDSMGQRQDSFGSKQIAHPTAERKSEAEDPTQYNLDIAMGTITELQYQLVHCNRTVEQLAAEVRKCREEISLLRV